MARSGGRPGGPRGGAVRLGLATFAVPRERLLDEARAFAERLAALPHQALQETKALLNQQLRASAVAALGYGLAAESQSHDTAEYLACPTSPPPQGLTHGPGVRHTERTS